MRTAPTALSTRADQVSLPGGPNRPFQEVLAAEAGQDTWRIVELVSRAGGPFEAELAWSSGGGVGAKTVVTVPTATRVSVYARSLRVRARNLWSNDNRVSVTIADGRADTHNQYEVRGRLDPQIRTRVRVPPFARTVRADLADTALTRAELQLLDGAEVLRARVSLANQPASGLPVGGAHHVQLQAPTPTQFRLLFDLTL